MNLEIIVGFIGTIVSIVTSLILMAYWLGRKFAGIDERFKNIDEKFKNIDERFKNIDEKFKNMENNIDARFKSMENSIDARFKSMEGRIGLVERAIRGLAEAFSGYQEFFIEYLISEGVVKSRVRSLLVGEARRLMRIAVQLNPLSKEEWEKIKLYLDKSERDEITIEEAEEFRELARKVTREYGHLTEAWKLHIYATMTLAFTRKKYLEEQKSD
ncbi:MAG: hypothetical protein QW803_11260 [Candidatus Methanomethylicia archaeon]